MFLLRFLWRRNTLLLSEEQILNFCDMLIDTELPEGTFLIVALECPMSQNLRLSIDKSQKFRVCSSDESS